jgi:hypothetical protein
MCHAKNKWHPSGDSPNNENGRDPTEIRGVRKVYHPLEEEGQLTQGHVIDSKDTTTPCHCSLTCSARIFVALSNMIVSMIGVSYIVFFI